MTITAIPPLPAITDEDKDSARRAAFIEGLRAFADVLEMSPEVPLPFHGRLDPVTIHFLAGEDPRAALVAAARAIDGPEWREAISDYTETGGGTYHDLLGELHGLRLRLTAERLADVDAVNAVIDAVNAAPTDDEARGAYQACWLKLIETDGGRA